MSRPPVGGFRFLTYAFKHCPYLIIVLRLQCRDTPLMPRIARIVALGYPHHVTPRGNNRSIVFFDDEDRQTYLQLLGKYSKAFHLHI